MGSPSSGFTLASDLQFPETYVRACELAEAGQYDAAKALFRSLAEESLPLPLQALVHNNLGVLDIVDGDNDATPEFRRAFELHAECSSARENYETVKRHGIDHLEENTLGQSALQRMDASSDFDTSRERLDEMKVAVVSLLFNWPARSGGNIHTVELADFLGRAGYTVQHFYARFPSWGLGEVDGSLPIRSTQIDFDNQTWHPESIQQRFELAVHEFDPDAVIITDCWNFKPLLAEALSGYPYFLRQQALECLCPLNNLRLLAAGDEHVRQCGQNQLNEPAACLNCLGQHGEQSGALHQAERALAGVGTKAYETKLRRSLRNAQAILVLNPLIKEIFDPFARRVEVVPWGMDTSRFPWPWPEEDQAVHDKKMIFMAGVVGEVIKGFHVLHKACGQLWQKRQDFQLVATGSPPGQVDAFTRFTGWLSQTELPQQLRNSDIVAVPTIAQEGLSRTSVEAMAVGRPVVGSRIGGVPYTVSDGVTGLLFRPGDATDLAEKIERLLDAPQMCERMGLSGRRRFEDDFTWEGVIARSYRPLLEEHCQVRVVR